MASDIHALRSRYNTDAGTRRNGTTSSPLRLLTVLFSSPISSPLFQSGRDCFLQDIYQLRIIIRMKGKGAFMLVLAGWALIGLMMLTTAVDGAPHPSDYTSTNNHRDFRSRRGFKTVGLATARGFGKRAPAFNSFQDISEQIMQQDENPISDPDVFPVDWMVNYLQNKPEVIRYMVDHLLDHNGDGQVTSQELITSLQQRED